MKFLSDLARWTRITWRRLVNHFRQQRIAQGNTYEQTRRRQLSAVVLSGQFGKGPR